MVNRKKARIIGLGSYLPEQILTNKELEKMVETNDEWIISRTGIGERRIAANDQAASDMGMAAALIAIERSGIKVDAIDTIIVATMTPDYLCPSTAALIQHRIGANNASAVDIQAACAGFLYGVSMAKAYLESGMSRNLLLIASEKTSCFIDYKDRNTCILFGDGAAAAVMSTEGPGFVIDTVCLGADGSLGELIKIPAGGSRNPATEDTVRQGLHTLKMEGKEVFKHAVRRMTAAAQECLRQAGLREEQMGWLVPHQANLRIMEAIAKNFSIPDERAYRTVHKYGNTSASSVAIALDELVQTQPIQTGEHLLLVAFGAGLTWGASILTKIDE